MQPEAGAPDIKEVKCTGSSLMLREVCVILSDLYSSWHTCLMDRVIKRDHFHEVCNHTVNYTTNNRASELLKVHQKRILLFSKDAFN